MDIEDVVDKNAVPITYTQFEKDAIDYRYHDTGKGFLIEKRIANQPQWTQIGIGENQVAVDKYFSILFNSPPGMDPSMKDKLLNAIVSGESINDMLKKNRKRSTGLLDGLMKRL